MSDQKKHDEIHGVVAYFDDVDSVMSAARKVRDAGYKKWDTYTPFPVHGIDEAMGTKPIMMLVLLILGMAAGLLNSVRTVSDMHRKLDEKDLSAQNGSEDEE